MLMTASSVLIAAVVAANADANWLTISPGPSRDEATVILPPTPVGGGLTYLLAWEMRVEGEKTWRFRADFAGVAVHCFGSDGKSRHTIEKQTSCWQTLDWQSAWIVVEPPRGTHAIDAAMAIVSKEELPGRFRVRNVRLIDLADPIPLSDNEGELNIAVAGYGKRHVPARVYIVDEHGEGVVPAFTYAYTQGTRCFELIDPRLGRIALPAGRYTVRAMKGFEYAIAEKQVDVRSGVRTHISLNLERSANWGRRGWLSVDHHTHLFRHGGSLYPMMDLNDVYAIAQAEGIGYLPFQGVDRALEPDALRRSESFHASYTQELTRNYWGHICPIFDRTVPSIAGTGNAAPMNMDYITAIGSGRGAVSYAHPYGPLRTGEEVSALADPKAGLIAREWPIDVALGVPCAIDMLAKEDARGEFALKLRDYMRLLNLGFRCGVAGSTDFHLDQGREPIGGLRTYARTSTIDWKAFAAAYNAGETLATNGPLIEVAVEGCMPGNTVKLDGPGPVRGKVEARSLWGLTRAQLWMNGTMVLEVPATGGAIGGKRAVDFDLSIEHSGWVLAIVEGPATPDVMTSPEGKPCVAGQYAITSPIYIDVRGCPAPPNAEAAEYFAGWCDAVRKGFDTLCAQQAEAGIAVPDEVRDSIHKRIDKSRKIFSDKAG
ncbi:MAG: CehA/McbA family metallohydrolase [Candidatus Hydrogenedentes bacterium]|nr:CehA/McbA family metallohydrolase [Candidatus Hydrogenedentota bacterium]